MALSRPYKKKTKPQQPFYEPSRGKTSAEVVSEARKELKAVKTRRPDTPGSAERHLFGTKQNVSSSMGRPPSVYSLGRRHFNEGDLSRPPTGQKLSPIERRPSAGSLECIPQESDPTPPTPTQSLSTLPTLAQTGLHHSTSHHGRVTATVGETVQASVAVSTSQDPGGRDSHHGDNTVEEGGGGSRNKAGRTVSSDAVSRKAETHVGVHSQVESPVVPRHHSAEEHAKGGTGGMKRTPASPKDKATAHWNAHVLPLLNKLHASAHNSEELSQLLDDLWEKLSRGNYLGRSGGVGGAKKRSAVLKTVFVLLDSKDPQLLLKVAKILLAMRVTGNNLQNACKLIFTISKDERNDPFFAQEQIIGILLKVLGDLDPASQPDAVVYCSGAVKLLCSNSELRAQMVAGGVIRSISEILKKLKEVPPGSSLQASSILIQIVGALRNLSDDISLREQFITHNVISGLCALLDLHKKDEELMFVVSRLFSKLTLHSDCCAAFASCRDALPAFCSLLELHISNPDLVVRVCFALGNITTSENAVRRDLFHNCNVLPTVCGVFQRYLTLSEEAGEKRAKCEDVLIKLQRLLANLAINEEVGGKAAQSMECTKHLMRVVELKSQWLGDEVLSNALAAVNNLTFYSTEDGPWMVNCEVLTTLLLDILLDGSREAMLDCLRVLGNLSRHQKACHFIVQHKVGEVVVTLLDSEDVEIVYAACGVLLNLMAVPDLRHLLTDSRGVRKLIEVLGDFGQNDWQLSSLVCKTLWNFSDRVTSSAVCFGSEEADLLTEQLEVYLDEEHVVESLPQSVPKDTRAYLYNSWKTEFCPVAMPLLGRIRDHHTNLVPL